MSGAKWVRAIMRARVDLRERRRGTGQAQGPDQRPGLLDDLGQSTLEFALTLFLLMAFLLFYVQLALMMGYGNYAHYATFMAARAYMAAGPSKGDQLERARSVMVRMVKRPNSESIDRFPSIAKADGDGDIKGVQINEPGNFNPVDPALSWLQGVRYSFKARLFSMPLGTGPGAAAQAAKATVKLQSESWLGREPTFDECKGEMNGKGIFDNGC